MARDIFDEDGDGLPDIPTIPPDEDDDTPIDDGGVAIPIDGSGHTGPIDEGGVAIPIDGDQEPIEDEEDEDDWPDDPGFPPEGPGGGYGGGSGHSSGHDRRMSITATILGSTLGPVYGKRRVGSNMMHHWVSGSTYYFGYAFAQGESVALESFNFNSEEITVTLPYPDCRTGTKPDWVKDLKWNLGTADSSNRPVVPAYQSWMPADDVSNYPGIVWCMFKTTKGECPGSIRVDSLVSGKKIQDFRYGPVPVPEVEDFEGYLTGQAAPGWDTTGVSVAYTVEDDGGNQVLQAYAVVADNTARLCNWTNYGWRENVDATALLKIGDSRTGLCVRVNSGGTRYLWAYFKKFGGVTRLQVYTRDGDTFRQLHVEGTTLSVGDWAYIRIYTLGDEYRVGYTPLASGPPVTWDKIGTQSYVTGPGYVGVGFTGALVGNTALIDDVSVVPSDVSWNFANPALIAYDICTDLEMWKGLDILEVNTDQLAEIADWCDEVVDDEERWHFHGSLDIRDTDAALQEVLLHCHTTPYVYDQTMHFIANKPPSVLPGHWTESGGQLVEDETTPGATDGLEVGDQVMMYVAGIHHSYTVIDVINEYVFEVAEPLEAFVSVVVNQISTIYFTSDDYTEKGAPSSVDIDFAQQADVVLVRFASEDGKDWKTIRCEDPDGYEAGDPRMRESTLMGAKTAGVATRWGQLERRILKLTPFEWEMSVGAAGAPLQPGDVFRFDTMGQNGLRGALARCLAKTEDIVTGTFAIRCAEFDMGVYSDDVADDDAIPGDFPNPVIPVTPSAWTHRIVEGGDWDGQSRITNPDDITGQFTVQGADLQMVYDGVEDETVFTLTGGPHVEPWMFAYLDVTDWVKDHGNFFLSFVERDITPEQPPQSDVTGRYLAGMQVWYAWGYNHNDLRGVDWRWCTPFTDQAQYSLRQRIGWRAWIRNTYPYHEVRLVFGATEDISGQEYNVGVKRVRLVGGWGEPVTVHDPWRTIEQKLPDGSPNPLYGLKMSEDFEWTPGPGAAVNNRPEGAYELWKGRGWADPDEFQEKYGLGETTGGDRVRRGNGSMKHPTLNMHSGNDLRQGLYMRAVSTTGHKAEFPYDAITQLFASDQPPPVVAYNAFFGAGTIIDCDTQYWFSNITIPGGSQPFPIQPDAYTDYEVDVFMDLGSGQEKVATVPFGKSIHWGNAPESWIRENWSNDYGVYIELTPPYPNIANGIDFYVRGLHSQKSTRMVMGFQAIVCWGYYFFLAPDVLYANLDTRPITTIVGGVEQTSIQRVFECSWTEFLGGPFVPYGWSFETRNSSQRGSVHRKEWLLEDPDATSASFSVEGQATFAGELPIPPLHDEFRIVPRFRGSVCEWLDERWPSDWVPITYTELQNVALAMSASVIPKQSYTEMVVVVDEIGPLMNGGDEFVVKKNFTTPGRVDQGYETITNNDGDPLFVILED